MSGSARRHTGEDLLAAVQRLDSVLAQDPDRAVDVLVEEVRRLTGTEFVMFTMVEEIDGVLSQHATRVSVSEDNAVDIAAGDHWRWADSACIRMLREGVTYTPDFQADHPDHALAARLGIRGFLSVPVLGATGDHVAAVLCSVDSRGVVIPDDVLALVRVLTASAVAPLVRAWGARAADADERASADAAVEVAAQVRRGQDEVGNSLAVAMGWLEVLAEDGASPGAGTALRRLAGVEGSVTDVLRRVHDAGVGRSAHRPVDLAATLREAIGADVTVTGADEAWVLAHRTHLSDFLTGAAGSLAHEVVVTDDAVVVPLVGDAALTTAALLVMDASGGQIAEHERRAAVAWARTAQVAVP